MERRLIAMRHAKSSWSSDAPTDHARPLNARGRRDAPRVAKRLTQLDWTPQYVLSSDSQRTRETCGLMAQCWEEGIEIEFLPTLYHAGASELQDELPRVLDEVETLMVVGHNPGWQEIVYRLCEEPVTMKTAAAALLEADCDAWGDAFRTRWSLHGVVYPKELD